MSRRGEMYCKNCGSYNKDVAKFCSKCGTKLKVRSPESDREGTMMLQPEDGSEATSILRQEVRGASDPGEHATAVSPAASKPLTPDKSNIRRKSFPTGDPPIMGESYPSPVAHGISAITEAELPDKFKPLSAWAYFGYSLLFGVVPFGWIVAIVFAVGKTENVNLRNFARSFFCYLVVVVILVVLIFGVAGCSLGSVMYSL